MIKLRPRRLVRVLSVEEIIELETELLELEDTLENEIESWRKSLKAVSV